MTIAALAVSWVVLVAIVRPGGRALARLAPHVQAVVALITSVALALIPLAAAATLLSRAAREAGMHGLRGCGRLVWAILSQPLARPDLLVALALLVIIPTGLAYGVVSAWRSQRTTRKLVRPGRGALVVVPASAPFAFTAGLVRPRVVVSRGFFDTSPAEFHDVVLAHEEAHRAGRHPLLLFIAEAVARAMPLPPLRWAADSLRFALESIADDRVAGETNDRELVAAVVAGLALAHFEAVPAFEGNEVRRVRRLLATHHTSWPRGALAVAAAVSMLLFAGAHGAHCAVDSLNVVTIAQCRLS